MGFIYLSPWDCHHRHDHLNNYYAILCQSATGEFKGSEGVGDRGMDYLAADDTLLLLDRMRDLTTRTLHLEVHCMAWHNII